jgi:hypothetical protein
MKPQSSQRLRKVRKACIYAQNFAPFALNFALFALKKFCFDNIVGGWGQEAGSGELRVKS